MNSVWIDNNSENLSAWRHYMQNMPCPDSYITMAFYYLIAASLERRVYLGSEEMPTFPNQYIVLVGDPAVGKGLAMRPVKHMLKLERDIVKSGIKLNKSDLQKMADKLMEVKGEIDTQNLLQDLQNESLERTMREKSKSGFREKRLFYLAPDTAGFEAILRFHSMSARVYDPRTAPETVKWRAKDNMLLTNGVYQHRSIAFCLGELSNFFKEHTLEAVRYLLDSYDCGDYDYFTKSEERRDYLTDTCLSLLAGTTPGFMSESVSESIIGDGLTSRIVFVYEYAPRFYKYGINHFTDDQIRSLKKVEMHIRRLSTLFGRVSMSPEAHEYLRHYFEQVLPYERTNYNRKLEPYYGRKPVITDKLCMAIHFADNVEDFTITLQTAQRALKILETLESRMHLALQFKGQNPLASVCRKVTTWLRHLPQPATKIEIWKQFIEDLDSVKIDEVLNYLIQSGQVQQQTVDGKMTYGIK